MKPEGSPTVWPLPAELLPHRPPMLLLRAVLGHSAGETCCEGWFEPAFAQFCGGEVPSAFALELIAQTAAVHHGLCEIERGAQFARATRGLLLGSRRLELLARTLPTGEALRVTVQGGQEPPAPGGLIRFQGWVENAAGERLTAGDATVLEWRPDVRLV
jgi:predicted hotdog family 3-hydroxylacyl-ACP dehydratase